MHCAIQKANVSQLEEVSYKRREFWRIIEIFCLFCCRALQNPLFKESFINFEVNEAMERLNFAYFLWSLRPFLKCSSSSPSTILQISFPPIPGYKSATIWCLLDNDESGHVNVCEHRAPRLPLLPAF